MAQMIDDVIRREGGYVNHPADRGGPTKYGITQTTLDRWWLDVDGPPLPNVRDMPESLARDIYRHRYYLEPGIDKLPEMIQPIVFDAAVNHGPKRAIEMVQAACMAAGHDPGPIDGIVGPRTIAAAERYARAFLDHLIDSREVLYREIVERDPSQAVFLDGWMNRLAEFREKTCD